jgi:hypothetical protein
MANLKSVIELLPFHLRCKLHRNENGFCSKAKESTRCNTAMRPYAEKLTELLQNLSATLKVMQVR